MSNLTHLRYLLEDARSRYVFSGFQLHFERDERPISFFGGVTSYWPDGRDVTEEVHFDLGSLTKVIFATSVIARFVERGRIKLESVVQDFVPFLKGTRLGMLPIDSLLTHSSGLVGWLPYFRSPGANLTQWLKDNETTLFQSSTPRYSDIGFWLLGLVLESLDGPLAVSFTREVLDPLKLDIRFGGTSASAATEYCLWRKRILKGEVFDENCHAMGGVAAHAGLFGNARAVAAFAREWLRALRGNSKWLKEETARRFTSKSRSGADWALGWDTRSEKGSSAGSYFSRSSFGHLGFPGCSIWIDPEANGLAVLLSNRVHPSRFDERIRALRPMIHNEIALLWKGSNAA